MDLQRTSPLFQFIFSDNFLPEIRELLARGVDLNSQDYGGFTPLLVAVGISMENIGVIRELIKAGADVNMIDHLGHTSLHYAVFSRKLKTVETLIQSGASVNAKTFLGTAPLHLAVIGDEFAIDEIDIQIIKELLNQEDIDVNVVDSFGETPLMLAVVDLQFNAVVTLLRNNANPNICNNLSESPLHEAFAQPIGFMEIQLLRHGASIYTMDRIGQTPIDILLENGNRSIFEVMDVLRIIAFKYNITDNIKRELGDPELLYYLNKCCEEVDEMHGDVLSGNITVHDFACNCFNENQFTNIILQIHKPAIDRLVKDIYPEYFADILEMIPHLSLLTVLQITARLKMRTESGNVKDIADVFSEMELIILMYEHLSDVDIFCLIVSFSNVEIPVSMEDVHERYPMSVIEYL